MRDIISNDTLAQIAKTVDEIIVNIGNNIKSIEQPVGALEGDTVLFIYKDYNGTVKTITVNDVRFFINNEPLGVYDYKYSNVVRHNKYIYIRIADKSGFYLEGNRNREYEPNAKMTWEQGGHSFGEDGYFGKLEREQYDNPQWSNDQYLQYCLFGLEIGKTYTFSFSAQFQLPQYDEHPSDHVAGGTNSKPFGLLFSSQEYVSAELIESLPENRGVWNPTEHFQSFYDDVDTSHTYTCTFTADSSIVSESGITYLTFIFTAASYRYKINFFWGSFKTAEGIDILSKHIFWDDSWFNLGTGGGSYTLPIASATELGGIKVGQNLSINANGVLSATGGGGGTSDLDAIELTYAEYQALTPAEKTDPNKIYFVTDYPSGGGSGSLAVREHYGYDARFSDIYILYSGTWNLCTMSINIIAGERIIIQEMNIRARLNFNSTFVDSEFNTPMPAIVKSVTPNGATTVDVEYWVYNDKNVDYHGWIAEPRCILIGA